MQHVKFIIANMKKIKVLAKPNLNFKLQTSNFKLQTSNFKLQTSNFKLQTSNLKPQTPNSRLSNILSLFNNNN